MKTLKRDGSWKKSPDQLKNEKMTVNPQDNDEEFLKYVLIASLHQEETNDHPEEINDLKPFVDRYKWEKVKFLNKSSLRKMLKIQEWCIIYFLLKKFHENNIEIKQAYIFENNLVR